MRLGTLVKAFMIGVPPKPLTPPVLPPPPIDTIDDPWDVTGDRADADALVDELSQDPKRPTGMDTWGVATPGSRRGLFADYGVRAAATLAENGDYVAALSARDLGIDISRLAQEGPAAPTPDDVMQLTTAGKMAYELPSFYGSSSDAEMEATGRVPQNWTMPIPLAPGMPLLEQITNRIQRSIASLQAYHGDAVVGPAIDILAEFPLSRGFTIDAMYNSDEFPPWFDPDWVDADSLVDANGESKIGQAVSAWVANECQKLSDRLRLVYQLSEMQKEAYIHGDGFLYRVDQIETEPGDDSSRIYPENDIADIQALNPTAVWIAKDAVGQVVKMLLVGQPGIRATDLPLDQAIHIKHRGNAWSTYGIPQTMRVFEEVEVKAAYLKAARAWGTRYATPIKMLQYGLLIRAGQNSIPAANPMMRDEAIKAVQAHSPETGDVLVGPFHWKYTLVGAEGSQMIAVSNELAEANKRILAGLGVPAAFLFGDWSNYATARIQYSGLMHRLKGVQESLQWIAEQRIFLPFCQMRGFVDNTGTPITIRVRWRRAHLEDDASYMQLIAAIAAIPQQNILSDETMREAMGFANEVEVQRFAEQLDQQRRKMADQASFQQQHPEVMPPTESPAGPGGGSSNDTDNEDGKGSPDMTDARKPKPTAPTTKPAAQKKKAARKAKAQLGRWEQRATAALEQAREIVTASASVPEQRLVAMRLKQARVMASVFEERLIDLAEEIADLEAA